MDVKIFLEKDENHNMVDPLGIPYYLKSILGLLTIEDEAFIRDFIPIELDDDPKLYRPTAGGVKRSVYEASALMNLSNYWTICAHKRGAGKCAGCPIVIGGDTHWKK